MLKFILFQIIFILSCVKDILFFIITPPWNKQSHPCLIPETAESELLIRDIEQYLPERTTEETEDIAQKDRPKEKSQRALLKEMKKLDQ